MKFWKSLSLLIEETLPDWRDKFLSYKDLKKHLKAITRKDQNNNPPRKRCRLLESLESKDCTNDSAGGCPEEVEVSKEVINFVRLLEEEVEKFNGFFVEKEEEYVIKWKELQDRAVHADDSNEELMKVGREIVDFHGEMVLLENYSALNYTGLVKILKKYDKRTGALIRMPFIQKVVQEPFFTTDVLNQLVKECEVMLDRVFSMNTPSTSLKRTNENMASNTSSTNMPSSSPKTTNENMASNFSMPSTSDENTNTESKERLLRIPKELSEIENMESMYMKLTHSALRVLKEIRGESSTVSMYSLPPLQSKMVGKEWKNMSVLEQSAK